MPTGAPASYRRQDGSLDTRFEPGLFSINQAFRRAWVKHSADKSMNGALCGQKKRTNLIGTERVNSIIERTRVQSKGMMRMRIKTSIFLAAVLSFCVFALALPAGGQEEDKSPILIKQVQSFFYCCLTQTSSREGIPRAIRHVWQLMEDQVIAPTGPALGVFYEYPEKPDSPPSFSEIGFPITPQTQVLAPLALKRWSHTTVVEAYYLGPLERANETYEQMMAWMHDQGYVQSGLVMEMYFADPITTEPNEYKTRIWIPCDRRNPSP